ncbi:MAG: DNA-directed RNA polymerase subunit H [Candidatus Woesearchaeota archaeon]|nr:DNA-directed RNA polymerase subunit H [Candidatus Woesearchaeota archaeon]
MAKKIEHNLVPEHIKLSESEKQEILKKYNITENELPKILKSDAAIAHLDVKDSDVIKILRKSPTAGESIFYRVVKFE